MLSTAFNTYFIIQYTIFYNNYNYVMAMFGENVRQVNEDEFLSVVSLMRIRYIVHGRSEINHKCTGTLVSRQDVITAEHCLRTIFTEGFKVMVGHRDLRHTTEYLPIFVWTYEHWYHFRRGNHTSLDHDLAIVKISANIPENIPFAPAGNIPNENLYGMQVDAAGWGTESNRTAVRILRTGKVRIMTYLQCQTRYLLLTPVIAIIHERYLCSIADPPLLLTEGDSGGPIFFFGALVGVSKGIFPAVAAGPYEPYLMNLHMSLRYYREFFDDVITTFHLNF